MADKSLLPHINGSANRPIVAAIGSNDQSIKSPLNGVDIGNGTASNHNNNNNDKNKRDYVNRPPPDGGARAWCVMLSAFLCNSILFGIINTCGTIYLTLQEDLTQSGDTEASSKAALVGSLTIGTTFFLSPVSGILTDKIGLRMTTIIGGILTAGGMFLSAVFCENISILYLTYGIMFGFGAALAYTPTIAILGHYFKNYLGIVSGFVTSGSSVFTAILPIPLNYSLKTYGLSATFCVLGSLSCVVMICAMIYKPLQAPPPAPKRKPGQSAVNSFAKSLVNVDNWKRKRYVIWAFSIPIALVGYFAPYVHLAKHVKDTFPGYNENTPIICIGITSGLGRLFFGYIADYKCVNRILLQQISFAMLGVFYMTIPLTDSYYLLLLISLGIGVVDGCFISLLGPIAYDLCGSEGATQAIGFLLGLCSVPLTVGPPIAGMLYDQTKSYKLSFILAGIPALVGASIMTLIHRLKDDKAEVQDHEQINVPLAKPAWNDDNALDIKLMNGNGKTFHDDPKLVTIQSTGINEKTGLLRHVNISAVVEDVNLPFLNRFQSKREYDYELQKDDNTKF